MPRYLAITLGPIIRTLSQARKTRELWGASYLFSYISRTIIRKLLDKDSAMPVQNDQIINPGRDNHSNTVQKGAGLYPDRIFVLLNDELETKKVIDWVNIIIEDIINELAIDIGHPELTTVLHAYLRVYCTVADIGVEDNIFLILNEQLAALELQERLEQPWSDDYPFTAFTDDANGAKFLADAFKGYGKQFTFRSIPEISTIDLQEYRKNDLLDKRQWNERYNAIVSDANEKYRRAGDDRKQKNKIEGKTDDNFFETLKNTKPFNTHFKAYHKYFCIVYADGDSVGAALGKIARDPARIKDFTHPLFEYTKKALSKIKEYKGTSVYAGGDDLLFFAPLVYNNGKDIKTIFGLVNEINELFGEFIKGCAAVLPAGLKPTLSFGISITYYKYPLNEALNASKALLTAAKKNRYFEVADDRKRVIEKNSIAFRLYKHSGQNFGSIFGYSSQAYQTYFKAMLAAPVDTDNFLSSIQYSLHTNNKVIDHILRETEVDRRRERLENFFKNNFNEAVHSKNQLFLETVQGFILSVHEESVLSLDTRENGEKRTLVNKTLDDVYAALRFIHFINQGDK